MGVRVRGYGYGVQGYCVISDVICFLASVHAVRERQDMPLSDLWKRKSPEELIRQNQRALTRTVRSTRVI